MTERRIRVLDDQTINQIAAGEVIENVASVIKELLENALDAQAYEIIVETEGCGRGLIRVIDNGFGMERDQLLLSVERHATSKLKEVNDLDRLKTLGFRGEALPSIASISQMSMHSATGDGLGSLLKMEGGKIKSIGILPRRKGTTVEVRSLFFNVPVRKQFQKSVASDYGAVHKLLIQFALSHPMLSLTWINDQAMTLSFGDKQGLDGRVQEALGEEFFRESLPLKYEKEGVILRGRLSQPWLHRPNKTGQYLFVNQRALVSPWFSQQVLKGYGTRLSTHRYPLFVIHMDLPPDWIDINVHPQKREARFKEERRLEEMISEAISRSLERRTEDALSAHEPSVAYRTEAASSNSGSLTIDQSWELSPQPKSTSSDCLGTPPSSTAKLSPISYSSSFEPQLKDLQPPLPFYKPEIQFLGKLNHFLLANVESGIALVNGLRAFERIIFEGLKDRPRQEVQALLLPITLTLPLHEKHRLLEKMEELNRIGVKVRHFGQETFLIDAIPALLEPEEILPLVRAYLDEGAIPKRMDAVLRRSIPNAEVAIHVVKALFACKEPEWTPLGKRTYRLLTMKELENILDRAKG